MTGKVLLGDGINENDHTLFRSHAADINLIHFHINMVGRHIGDDHSRLSRRRPLAALDVDLRHHTVDGG